MEGIYSEYIFQLGKKKSSTQCQVAYHVNAVDDEWKKSFLVLEGRRA